MGQFHVKLAYRLHTIRTQDRSIGVKCVQSKKRKQIDDYVFLGSTGTVQEQFKNSLT